MPNIALHPPHYTAAMGISAEITRRSRPRCIAAPVCASGLPDRGRVLPRVANMDIFVIIAPAEWPAPDPGRRITPCGPKRPIFAPCVYWAKLAFYGYGLKRPVSRRPLRRRDICTRGFKGGFGNGARIAAGMGRSTTPICGVGGGWRGAQAPRRKLQRGAAEYPGPRQRPLRARCNCAIS